MLAGVHSERYDCDGAGRLSIDKARKLLGKDCTLSDQQLSELIEGFVALADAGVHAFVEQRKRRKSVASEQRVPTFEAVAGSEAVA